MKIAIFITIIMAIYIFLENINAIKRYFKKGRKSMKNRIESLSGIGKNARKITTEIGGNYAICVSTEAASKKKHLCVYQSSKGLSFVDGAVHSRKLVKAFPYASEEGLVEAQKQALMFIARREGKIEAQVGDEITVNHAGKNLKVKVLA